MIELTELLEVIRQRSSVRLFKETPIDVDSMRLILEAALRAPTAGGAEAWFFVVVKSDEMCKCLHQLLLDAHRIYFTSLLAKKWTEEKFESWVAEFGGEYYFAPLYVVVFADLRERVYKDPCIEEFWAHQSCAAAVENMLLAACDLGIGSCWYGVPLLLEAKLKKLLGVDDPDLRLSAVVGFGYPRYETKPRSRRKGLEAVMKIL
ncbi:MAG: nitroreductase family protein [Candidatus Methanosuratincola petrocarbonis]